MTAFVPGNVGFEAVTRESVINDHTTTLARHLFAGGDHDRAILVADGTYLRVEKSGNHKLQVYVCKICKFYVHMKCFSQEVSLITWYDSF